MGKSPKLFGTDGVRGVANLHPADVETALALGRAIGYRYFASRSGGRRPTVVIGKDTRLSGYMLESALAAGFCSVGANVYFVGPLPTPGIAFLVRSMRADVGIVVSASHNPFEDNGIKIFDAQGHKLSEQEERALEDLIPSKEVSSYRPTGEAIGRAKRIDDAIGRYIVAVKAAFPPELTLEGLRVVVDCANGAAYRVAPTILEELGAEVYAKNCSPNGQNINDGCGAIHPQAMVAAQHSHRAEIGIALDGDADRVVLCDEKGVLADGDTLLAICALAMHRDRVLRRDTVVATIMSNLGLHRALAKVGGRVEVVPVGDRHVIEAMRKGNYSLGGESSGHLVFGDHSTTGDGILAALQILAIMKRTGKPLSELRRVFEPCPQVHASIPARDRVPIEELPGVSAKLKALEASFRDKMRVVLRLSGTEPIYRVMVEGEDPAELRRVLDELCELVSQASQKKALTRR